MMRIEAAVLLVALSATSGAAVPTNGDEVADAVLRAEAERVAVVERVRPAVLAIFGAGGRGGGSGVVISPDGYALSNFHVTRGAGNWMQCGMADGELYDAVIVGIDPVGDVALIKLIGRDDFPAVELGDSDETRVGDWTFAMGNPFLLATDFQPTVTYGIVSGVHRYQYPAGTLLEYPDCIQIDASINPGNSGGPLFDSRGQLIGINGRGSFEKRGRVNVGVGYAISVNQIKHFMGYLRGGLMVDHATLGARVETDEDGRVVVTDILERSDAYRHGLRVGDEIVHFAGRPIRTANAFTNTLGTLPKGWRVPISYRRSAEQHDALVRLRGVHRAGELESKAKGRPPMPPDGRPRPRPGPDEPRKPGDDPDGKRPQPIPQPMPAPAPMPEAVKKLFEAKEGFANYFFNKLQRERVWKAAAAIGDFSSLTGTWSIVGETADGKPIRFELTDDGATADRTSRPAKLVAADGLAKSLEPPGRGGLLAALHLWRRLLVLGPEQYGKVDYFGTAPLAGHDGLHDVLVGAHGGVEARFVFDSRGGRLLAIELYPDDDADPCEVYFSEYAESGGRSVPHRMAVRHGDDVFGVFKLSEFKFDKREDK